MRRLPSPSKATCLSEAKLLKKLQHRVAARSRDLTPLAGSACTKTGTLSECSFSTRNSLSAKSSRFPASRCSGPPTGVSAACLVSCLVDICPTGDSAQTTRATAAALRLKREEERESVHSAVELAERQEVHPLTGGDMAGPCSTHVVHAWDASFPELVDCLVRDAGSDLDKRYSVDIFGAEHLSGNTEDVPESAPARNHQASQMSQGGRVDDPVATVQALVQGAKEVLLVLDKELTCFSRLWVLTEAMMATAANKLRISTADPRGYGSSMEDILRWESRIDAIDWSLAEASRKSDERRIRSFSERVWDLHGIGNERLLAQLKVLLRKEVNGQLLIKAVEAGDSKAIHAALDRGASLEQRDADGNTLEDLACFYNHQDIEEMLFERRMRGKAHKPLSMFFRPEDLMENCAEALPEVLLPFMTQPNDGYLEGGADDEDDEETWRYLASFEQDAVSSGATAVA